VKICSGVQVTELNGVFTADEFAVEEVLKTLKVLGEGDILVMSGSLPNNIVADFYSKQVTALSDKNVKAVIDTSGEALRKAAKNNKVFLLAPNNNELAQLFEDSVVTVDNFEEAIVHGAKLRSNTLVSMGEKGAVFIDNTGNVSYICETPKVVKCGYTVGAGDTLLAGFIAEYIKTNDYQKALIAAVNAATDYVESNGK
jgi:1-phosphofructokinase